jgi:pre-mRNA-processing factor 6
MARDILTKAFAANPDSESVWLAAAKLEWETGEVERARVLLQRARDRAPSPRVYMKSALLERENNDYTRALSLIDEGIAKYPNTSPKLYMMAGQISSTELSPPNLDQARKYYQDGLKANPDSITIWTLAAKLEEKTTSQTKARSLFELARLKNPRNASLWVESIRLERRANNDKLATTLMARALQECPNSGLLLAENIRSATRVQQKSRSADAIKKCPDDPLVISAVANLFVLERKEEKARKWLERAVVLDPDLGDSWGRYLAFETHYGTVEQQQRVRDRCVKSEPKHGEIWCAVAKDMANRRKTIKDILEIVVKLISEEKQQAMVN